MKEEMGKEGRGGREGEKKEEGKGRGRRNEGRIRRGREGVTQTIGCTHFVNAVL